MDSKDVSLALFLTRAVPMNVWHKNGTLERETLYYKELGTRLHQITFVSCGGKSELDFTPAYSNIDVLYNSKNVAPNLYSLIAPIIHRKALSQVNVFKTNQLDGAWTAIIAGKILNKPVIVRAGYVWSDFFRQEGGQGFKVTMVDILEKWCLCQAQCVFVTTQVIKDRFCEKYGLPQSKITVIPNFIDTSIFHPNYDIDPIKGRVCYVGRLDPIKNVDILIQAISQIAGSRLVIIGAGKEMEKLEALSRRLHADVSFLGQLENQKLPLEIQKSEIFILPSSLEGHPKALIEAMACGCAVIGADVPGIRNLIRHEDNGLLCSPTVDDIRDSIIWLLENHSLRERIGNNASLYASDYFSLKKVVELEIQAILDFLSKAQIGDNHP